MTEIAAEAGAETELEGADAGFGDVTAYDTATTEDLSDPNIDNLIKQEIMSEFRVVRERMQEELKTQKRLQTRKHKRFIERGDSGEADRLVLFSGAEHKGVNVNLIDHRNGNHTITRATIKKDGTLADFEEGDLGKPLHKRYRGITLAEQAFLLLGLQEVINGTNQNKATRQTEVSDAQSVEPDYSAPVTDLNKTGEGDEVAVGP